MYLSRPGLEAKKGRTVANREIQGVVHDIILIPPEKFGAVGAVQGERQLIAAQNNIRNYNGVVVGRVVFGGPEKVNGSGEHEENYGNIEDAEQSFLSQFLHLRPDPQWVCRHRFPR